MVEKSSLLTGNKVFCCESCCDAVALCSYGAQQCVSAHRESTGFLVDFSSDLTARRSLNRGRSLAIEQVMILVVNQ